MSPQADALSTRIMRFLPPRMLSTHFIAFIILRFCWSLWLPLLSKQVIQEAQNHEWLPWRRQVKRPGGAASVLWQLRQTVKTALEMKGGSLETSSMDEARQYFTPKALLCRGHCRRRTSSLGFAESSVTCAFRITIFSLKAHWHSTEKFAQHQHNYSGEKRIGEFVACDPASAGALLQESAQLVVWTGACGVLKEPPSGLKAEPLPLGSSEGSKTCFSTGPTENKFQRNRMKRVTAICCSPGVEV